MATMVQIKKDINVIYMHLKKMHVFGIGQRETIQLFECNFSFQKFSTLLQKFALLNFKFYKAMLCVFPHSAVFRQVSALFLARLFRSVLPFPPP